MFEDSFVEQPRKPMTKIERFLSWAFCLLAVAYIAFAVMVAGAGSVRDLGVWFSLIILFLAYRGQLTKIFA